METCRLVIDDNILAKVDFYMEYRKREDYLDNLNYIGAEREKGIKSYEMGKNVFNLMSVLLTEKQIEELIKMITPTWSRFEITIWQGAYSVQYVSEINPVKR